MESSSKPKPPKQKEPPVVGSADYLLGSIAGVVRRRDGGVLTRGFILKTDHYPTGRALDLEINISGAPNFRGLKDKGKELGVFGSAQPTVPGLKTILSLLLSSPSSPEASRQRTVSISTREEPILYISGRPFVLRDSAAPLRTLSWGGSAANLEQVEERLKNDVLREARSFGGVILGHEEVVGGATVGEMIPTWIHVDEGSVKTVREIYGDVKKEGWLVDYHRIPISPDRPIEDNYLDAYLSVLKGIDPLKTSVLISCGMGVVRTTFAMTAAVLVRRHQLLRLDLPDPFATVIPHSAPTSPKLAPAKLSRSNTPTNAALLLSLSTGTAPPSGSASGYSTPGGQTSQAERILENATQQHALNRSLLKLTHMLDKALSSQRNASASSLLSSRPVLLESLRSAHMGNYSVILSLLGCLEGGKKVKVLVDAVIDACDAVTNLREEIIDFRIKASIDLDDKTRQIMLDKASKSLEKLFFLISFAGFIEDSDGFKGRFSDWLKKRAEIWNQIMLLRRGVGTGSRLFLFAPVADLSVISRASGRATEPDGGTVMGNEWAEHVVANRSGIILRASTLLKSDQWLTKTASSSDGVRGAVGFRQIPGSNIYAIGQPTEDAIGSVLSKIKERSPSANALLWLNLREEPLVYINGQPFCLRKESLSLRNIKDYSGVSASRLEVLEDRLKGDVTTELRSFEGCLLLHSETADGDVVPVWEDCDEGSVSSVRDVMEGRVHGDSGLELRFRRLPMTSEKPPDFSDIAELMEIVLRTNLDETPIILNDQLGRGRVSRFRFTFDPQLIISPLLPSLQSTVASVIILLTHEWLREHRSSERKSSSKHHSVHEKDREEDAVIEGESVVRRARRTRQHSNAPRPDASAPRTMSWQVINNVLRVIRNGLEVKEAVDKAIDRAGQNINLRDCIEEARAQAAEATDPALKKQFVQEGIHHLHRYFDLIIYQAYLEETPPDTFENLESFESYVKKRPVFRTFQKELKESGLDALAPIVLAPADGLAMSDEVQTVVLNRSGQILSASTILKSDFFSNLQKLSLPDRVEGCANFRKAPMTLSFNVPTFPKSLQPTKSGFLQDEKRVYGTGMPSIQGLRRALEKMEAGPNGSRKVFWTSLREEPVIYINSRPHVLRLQDRPLVNVEATGVSTEIVEAMEVSFKRDVIREIKMSDGGRILLHDEVEQDGSFEIVPIWETVAEADVLTPSEVYAAMVAEGYQVDYARVAITDEQAPLPVALDALVHRVVSALRESADSAFNCQMGRGRTTQGTICACLISSVISEDIQDSVVETPSEEDSNPYVNGEYKTILSLVSVLSHGKIAKRLADRAINHLDGVQNLRKAVYDYKVSRRSVLFLSLDASDSVLPSCLSVSQLKAEAAPDGSTKQAMLHELGINYLYRYGVLITLANYLIEKRAELKQASSSSSPSADSTSFPDWLRDHREIKTVMRVSSLD
ncbi:inositol hexakisphosphate-domain-containing protein [Mrakia frigida]|uniref:inositol hexakisphosphate-domain-containing protein n=1 Tax=Mrakia frigida TaxID=29902 RepID=UPI003FCC237F